LILLQASIPTAILIDNMYLQHAANIFNVGALDPRKFPKAFLRQPPEEHFRTFIFDALPYVPDFGATEKHKEYRAKKDSYLKAIQYYEKIAVELGDVRPKSTHCPKCNANFTIPVQKLVDVKISVRLVALGTTGIVKKIVLVAGDKDLLPAVDAIKDTGTTVRLAYVAEQDVQTSKDLIRACPEKQKLEQPDIASCRFDKP
jgi:uncharacterized LabA/DUF88 family protein